MAEAGMDFECALCKGEASDDVGSICWVSHCQVSVLPSRALEGGTTWDRVVAKHARGGHPAAAEGPKHPLTCPAVPLGSKADTSYGVSLTTCGHKLHYVCYQNYMSTLVERSQAGVHFEGMQVRYHYEHTPRLFSLSLSLSLSASLSLSLSLSFTQTHTHTHARTHTHT